MPDSVLPPAIQDFVVNATEWAAGIDEMIAKNEELVESIGEVDAAGAGVGAGAGAGAAGAEGAGAAAGEDNALADAQERVAQTAADVAESGGAVSLALKDEAASATAAAAKMDIYIDSMGRARLANGRFATSEDIAAASADKEGVSVAAAGTKAEASGAKMESAGRKGKLAFLAVAAAVAYSVVKAAKFQTSINHLNTQAGVSRSKLAALGQGVLKLAGEVGEDPDSLAESLYHVESNFSSVGITSKKALGLVKVAAEGARTGGADLVDVTNALTAAVAANIPGVQDMSGAMGILNATVGAGDMNMQDLADAFGTGMVVVAKQFGLSIKDVGAALAIFGDNNIRGAKAGTDLKMAIQSLAQPGAGPAAVAMLKKLGLSATTLRDTMTKGGLLPTLELLKKKMTAAGYTAKTSGAALTDLFTKKGGVGIGIILDEMDKFKSKYPALTKGAKNFGQAWKDTQKTVEQQFANLKNGAEAAGIELGEVLLPPILKIVSALNKVFQAINKYPILQKLAGVVVILAGAMGILTVATAALNAVTEINPWVLAIAAIAALVIGIIYAYKHFKTFRDVVADVGHFFQAVWRGAMTAAGAVIHWFVTGPLAFIKSEIAQFKQWWSKNGAEIKEIWRAVWTVIRDIVSVYVTAISGEVKGFLQLVGNAFRTGWRVISLVVKYAWNLITTTIRSAITIILDIIAVFADLLTGHWSKAWHDLIKLASDALHAAITTIKQIVVGFPMLLFNAGKALIGGLINGIKSMIGALASTVSGVAHKIAGFFGLSPAIEGPLSGQGAPEIRGQHFAADLARGITGGVGHVETAAKLISEKLANPPIPPAKLISEKLNNPPGYGDTMYGPVAHPGGRGGWIGGTPAGYGGGTTINIHMTLNATGNATWEHGLSRIVQKAVLDYALRNQGSGLLFPGRTH